METTEFQPFNLMMTPGYRLGRTFLRLKNGLRKEFLAHGVDVTPDQWGVLSLAGEQEGLTQSELGENLLKDKASITRILDRLEAKGLLVRRTDGNDRRTFRIFLTPEGRSLREQLIPISKAYARQCYRHITTTDIDFLQAILEKINEGIE